MRTQKILYFLLFNFFGLSNFAQTLGKTVAMADSFFQKQNYEYAIKLYSRAIFFNNTNNFFNLYYNLGLSYFYKQNYQEALPAFEFAYKSANSDSFRYECIFNKALCFDYLSKFQFARNELLSIDTLSLNSLQKRRYHFYMGISCFGSEVYAEAYENFSYCLESDSLKECLKFLFNKKNIKMPNPKIARFLSMVLPGSGQMLSSEIKSGTYSFLLNYSLLSAIILIANKYTILDAVLALGMWFQRYYQGGFTNAEQFAIAKLQKKRDKTLHEIFNLISAAK